MLGPLGLPELLVIMVILLILFGYKRMGQLGKGLGEGIRNFKESIRSSDAERGKDSGNESVDPK
jgi:sec-independent protein translocase protein TatA